MELWKQIVLICFSCGALVIALYCFLFMVPVKRFWERIDSLGGGMKGIEAYVDGVHDDMRHKLSMISESVQERLTRAEESSQAAVERVATETQAARRDFERLRRDLQSLQADLRAAAADGGRMARNIESLNQRIEELRGDFDALDANLQKAVRECVTESFSTVESTVLSALDAIQEEMLGREPGEPASGRRLTPHQRTTPGGGAFGARASGPPNKIEPLFAALAQKDETAEGDEDPSEPDKEDAPEGEAEDRSEQTDQ